MKKSTFLLGLTAAYSASSTGWQDKASATLTAVMSQQTEVEMIIKINSPVVQKKPARNAQQKIAYKVEQLKAQAHMSQQPVIDYLNKHDISYKSYWINNSLWIKTPSTLIPEILALNPVKNAIYNETYKLKLPLNRGSLPESIDGIEWNVSLVNAPDVWNLGFTGQNVVIAGQDTGYQWDHPLLISSYRGWDGQTANHNYNWHDSINNPNIPCGSEPCDDYSHGSHTMGTMTGDDGGSNQTGVAPGAEWIGCRNMNQGDGTPETYTACFQWFMEPTDLNGANPNSSLAPHIINNSWGCPTFEGCTQPDALLDVINNVVDAGILVVASAGNSGSGCNTVNTPAAIYDASYTVGSTTSGDDISGFSSRGSVSIDGSGRIKPDISAPGSSVRSANNSSGYYTISGTSMASPNVAGVAALVLSANPELIGRPEWVEWVINTTAVPLTSNQNCGGVSGNDIPNNTYGHGRVDALAAVNLALDLIFIDGFQ